MPAAAPRFAVRLRRTFREVMPSGHAWWLVGAGCAVGVLLFGVLWLGRPTADAGSDAVYSTVAKP